MPFSLIGLIFIMVLSDYVNYAQVNEFNISCLPCQLIFGTETLQ